MPTAKPRINLTVTQETFDILTELADINDVSRASIVNDLLEASMPALQRALVGLRALQERQRQLEQESADLARMDRDQMALRIGEAERMLAPLLADSLGVFDKLVEDAKRPTQPPHSNTGVTPPTSKAPSGGRKGSKARKSSHLRTGPHGGQEKPADGGRES
jgi:hypothetical protein